MSGRHPVAFALLLLGGVAMILPLAMSFAIAFTLDVMKVRSASETFLLSGA